MFDDLDKQNATTPPPKVEDILAQTDQAVKPEAFKPRPPGAPYETVVPADHSWLKNKGLIFGLITAVIVLAGAGFLALKFFIKKAPTSDLTGAGATNNIQTEPRAAAPAPAAEEANNINDQLETQAGQSAVTAPVDSDQDGLTDQEEVQFGTNAVNSDTDQDGLTDREEAKVYGTDPLKADTDGDGYNDGAEIKNGYNPKGAGKLLEINK